MSSQVAVVIGVQHLVLLEGLDAAVKPGFGVLCPLFCNLLVDLLVGLALLVQFQSPGVEVECHVHEPASIVMYFLNY